jgi:hypothetical protein
LKVITREISMRTPPPVVVVVVGQVGQVAQGVTVPPPPPRRTRVDDVNDAGCCKEKMLLKLVSIYV